MPKGFGRPTYREWEISTGLFSYRVTVKETDLWIRSQIDLSSQAEQTLRRYRTIIEQYIAGHAEFQTSFEPVDVPDDASPIIREMADAAARAGVGPFAAVAGAIAEAVGRELLPYSSDLLIENGGDVFAASGTARVFGLYAGNSRFSGKIGLKIAAEQMPCGFCTSSGTVGHSISFGKADAAAILASSAALADACATAVGNRVRQAEDIEGALQFAASIEDVQAAVIVLGDQIGAWGAVELVSI